MTSCVGRLFIGFLTSSALDSLCCFLEASLGFSGVGSGSMTWMAGTVSADVDSVGSVEWVGGCVISECDK